MNRFFPTFLLLTGTGCKDPVVMESYLAVVHISPNDGAVNIPVDTIATATFSEALDEDSVTPIHAYLEDSEGVPVDSELSYDAKTSTLTLVPIEALNTMTSYTLVLDEGLEGLESGSMLQGIETGFTTSGMGQNDDVNHSPTADAGGDQTVALNDDVILDGSLSSDQDDDDLTYWWEFIEVPDESVSELDDASLITPSFNADVVGTFIISLVVDDGFISSEQSYVQVFVEE